MQERVSHMPYAPSSLSKTIERRRLIFVYTLLSLGDGKLGHTETVTLIN